MKRFSVGGLAARKQLQIDEDEVDSSLPPAPPQPSVALGGLAARRQLSTEDSGQFQAGGQQQFQSASMFSNVIHHTPQARQALSMDDDGGGAQEQQRQQQQQQQPFFQAGPRSTMMNDAIHILHHARPLSMDAGEGEGGPPEPPSLFDGPRVQMMQTAMPTRMRGRNALAMPPDESEPSSLPPPFLGNAPRVEMMQTAMPTRMRGRNALGMQDPDDGAEEQDPFLAGAPGPRVVMSQTARAPRLVARNALSPTAEPEIQTLLPKRPRAARRPARSSPRSLSGYAHVLRASDFQAAAEAERRAASAHVSAVEFLPLPEAATRVADPSLDLSEHAVAGGFTNLMNRAELESELANVRLLFDHGFISAQEFADRERAAQAALRLGLAAVQEKREEQAERARMQNREDQEGTEEGGSATRRVKLFVSSTFRDMTNERDVIAQTILPQLRKYCVPRGVDISVVDLRWGVTVDETRNGETLRVCLSEIDRCRPYFICLLGERYGWAQSDTLSIDDLTEVFDRHDGAENRVDHDETLMRTFRRAAADFPWIVEYLDRSVTELEVRHAVLNDPRAATAQRCAFYFSTPSSDKSVDTSDSADEAGSSKLAHLKAEIVANALPVAPYSSAENLAELMLAQLKAQINADFPAVEGEENRVDPVVAARAPHLAFERAMSRVFVRREAYFRALDSAVLGSSDQDSDKSTDSSSAVAGMVCLCGARGSGKSAVLTQFVRDFRSSHPDSLVVAFYSQASGGAVGGSNASARLSDALRTIMLEIQAFYNIPDSTRSVPTDARTVVSEFPDWLGEAAERGGMFLALDGLDALVGDMVVHESTKTVPDSQLLQWLPRTFPRGVTLVCSATTRTRAFFEVLGRDWRVLKIESLSRPDQLAISHAYLQRSAKTLADEQLESLIEDGKSSTSNPLYLKLCLDELGVFGVFEELEAKIQALRKCRSPAELVEHVLSRLDLESKEGAAANSLGRALVFLAIARSGLSESELLSLCDMSGARWSRFYMMLEDAGFATTSSAAEGAGMIILAHDFVRAAVLKRYSNLVQPARASLIRFFRAVVDDLGAQRLCFPKEDAMPDASERKGHLNRALFELPFQYLAEGSSQSAETLARLLCAPEIGARYLLGHADAEGAIGLSRDTSASSEKSLASGSLDAETGRLKQDMFMFWRQLQAVLPQADEMLLSAIRAIAGRATPEGADDFGRSWPLLKACGSFFEDMAIFDKAEAVFSLALEQVRQRSSDSKENQTLEAEVEQVLGYLCRLTSRYDEASTHYRAALQIREAILPEKNQDLATTINSLAVLLRMMGRYDEAEPLYKRALRIRESLFGKVHEDVAQSYNSLGCLFQDTNRYAQAEKFLQLAVSVRERLCGQDAPDVAMSLQNLGNLYMDQSNFARASVCYVRARSIYEHTFGPLHPSTCQVLNSTAGLHLEQGHYDDAEELYIRTLDTRKRVLGPTHHEVALTLNDLAVLYARQDRLHDAQPLYEEALEIRRSQLGEKHPDYAQSVANLASLMRDMGQLDRAGDLFRQAIAAQEAAFGTDQHVDVASSLCALAGVLLLQRKFPQAQNTFMKALSVQRAMLGPDVGDNHGDIALTLSDVAVLYFQMGKLSDAESYARQALAAYENCFGAEHPDTAKSCVNLSDTLVRRAREAADTGDANLLRSEARSLIERAIAINEKGGTAATGLRAKLERIL
jgi:tetratricopeptide (TPR) repeat protein